MRSKAGWLLPVAFFLLLLFAPNKSLAHGELTEFDGKTLLRAGEKEYRLRAPNKSWQLADTANWKIEDHFEFDNQFFLIANSSAGRSLLVSQNGLGYAENSKLSGLTTLEWRQIGGELFILASDPSFKLFRYSSSQFVQINTPFSYSGASLERLIVSSVGSFFFNQSGALLTTYRLSGNSWLSLGSQSCLASAVVVEPLPIVSCDGYLFGISDTGGLVSLLSEKVTITAPSPKLLVASSQDTANRIFVVEDSQVTTIDLAEAVKNFQVFEQRIFLQTLNGTDYELLWQQPAPLLSPLPATGGSYVLEKSTKTLFYRTASQAWSSTSSSWSLIEVVAAFDQAQKTSYGWLLWQSEASSVQTSSDGVHFKLNNGAWAASSKIKDVIESNGKMYVFLLNSAQNPNLYRSDALVSWSRITLPTKPTIQTTIAAARALAASTLVEIEGVITVLPGEVSADVVYLQDSTGGIQLYLNSSAGTLPSTRFAQAVATGEISSSQVKRVSLGASDDLVLGNLSSHSPVQTDLVTAINTLGQRYLLRGAVSNINTDDFSLNENGASLKIHLTGAKTKLLTGETISLVVLVDWNSSSGSVEGWYTNELLEIPIHLVSSTTSPATSTTSNSTSSQVTSSKVSLATTTQKTASASAKTTPSSQIPSLKSSVSSLPTLVSASQDDALPGTANPELGQSLLSALTLVTLLSALRGRRLRKVLLADDP